MIWKPTLNTGLSEVIGSWKMNPLRAPRMLRSSSGEQLRRSTPSNITDAPDTLAGGLGRSPSSDIIVTDLPEPLSPTTPSNSPGLRSKLTVLTAYTSPERVLKRVWSRFTWSTGAIFSDMLDKFDALFRVTRQWACLDANTH